MEALFRPRQPSVGRSSSAPRPEQRRRDTQGAARQYRIPPPGSPKSVGSPLPESPSAAFTGRPGGGALRRYRIGSPNQRRLSLADEQHRFSLYGNMELTDEEKRHFDDFQKLRATIGDLTGRIDQVLVMLTESVSATGGHRGHLSVEDTDGDIMGEDGVEHKLDKLHRMVQEAAGDLASARQRIAHLEGRLHESQEELICTQHLVANLKQKDKDHSAELIQLKKELSEVQAERDVRVRKAEDMEKTVNHFQKLAVSNIRERKSRESRRSEDIRSSEDLSRLPPTAPVHAAAAATLRNDTEAVSIMDRLHRHAKERGGQSSCEGPTGRVTLVFTDIQGSTNLWESLQDRMHGQLEKHNNLIRQEIRRWKGYEVKTQGDSFMVAFSDPTMAVAFCMSVQLVLLKGDWDKILEGCKDAVKRIETGADGKPQPVWDGLRVRMGAHTGEPICQVDVTSGRMDYFGPVVNQSARVQGIAYGGMITLTPEVIDSMDRARLPSHLNPVLFPIGEFTLKGIEKPVPLQHALPPSLVARVDDFPPLRSKAVKDEKEIIAAAGAPVGRVTFCFLRMERAHEIESAGVGLWTDTLELFRNEVRVSCEIVGGYVSKIDGDRQTVVFRHAAVAFRWAMELQENLLRLPWPAELMNLNAGRLVQWRGRDIMRGARVQIGMHTCDDCQPVVDPITSQIAYVGEGVQVAGPLSLDARGGETLVSETVYLEVNETVRDSFLLAREQLQLGEWRRPLDCYLAYPRGLTGRAAFHKEVPLETFEGLGDDEDEDIKLAQTQAPFGNVAIVFTDIQNSTKLWDSDEVLMAQVVKLHHVAMRAGIQRFQGYEVKTEGDAFMVAFSCAMAATRWCLYMQEVLLALSYPDDFLKQPDSCVVKQSGDLLWRGVRVRMGVHNGQPQCEVDPVTRRMDYYGPMVNKAARVSSLAQGGQIVVSESTFEVISDQMKELGNPVVSDGGERTLKGISKATRVYFMLPSRLRKRTFKKPEPPAPKPPEEGATQKEEKVGGMEKMHANIEEEEQVRLTAAQAVAPTGIVALCFTDIQNSTHLWENCERMAQSVQQHHRVMRKGIARFNGYEVKTEGDAFMVAFSSTVNALGWCLAMQTALMEQSWDHELLDLSDAKIEVAGAAGDMHRIWGGPRVRMGVHVSGPPDLMSEPDPVSGRMDYYGRGVNKAARVGGKGKGGESVISGDVYDLIQQSSAEDLAVLGDPDIVFVGDMKLKGIAGTTRIYSCVPRDIVERRATWKKMDEAAAAQDVRPEHSARWAHVEAEWERREKEQRDAPTGVVSLVFTDIQSSTELWDGFEDSMRASVAVHHKLMRAWIKKLRGYEVKTEGDAFMVAFHTACDALAWCIGTQLELMKQEWPQDMLTHKAAHTVRDEDGNLVWHGPRVRMGIHTGKMDSETDPTMGRIDYYGPEVNKAARIGGLGVGGEIVISEQGLDAVRRQSSDLAAVGRPIVVFIGTKRLKGISKECHVYRIIPTQIAGRVYPTKEAPGPQPEDNKLEKELVQKQEDKQQPTKRPRRSSQPIDDDGGGDGGPTRADRERRGGQDFAFHLKRHELTAARAVEESDKLRGELEKVKSNERFIQLEFWKTHRHVRIFMFLVKKYMDFWQDRSKGLFSHTELIHDWIQQHRKIMEIEDPDAGDEPMVTGRKEKKISTREEIKNQLATVIETEEKERQLGLDTTTKTVVVSKLSPSIVAHLSKFIIFLAKVVEPKRRGTNTRTHDGGGGHMQPPSRNRFGSRRSLANFGSEGAGLRRFPRASVAPPPPPGIEPPGASGGAGASTDFAEVATTPRAARSKERRVVHVEKHAAEPQPSRAGPRTSLLQSPTHTLSLPSVGVQPATPHRESLPTRQSNNLFTYRFGEDDADGEGKGRSSIDGQGSGGPSPFSARRGTPQRSRESAGSRSSKGGGHGVELQVSGPLPVVRQPAAKELQMVASPSSGLLVAGQLSSVSGDESSGSGRRRRRGSRRGPRAPRGGRASLS